MKSRKFSVEVAVGKFLALKGRKITARGNALGLSATRISLSHVQPPITAMRLHGAKLKAGREESSEFIVQGSKLNVEYWIFLTQSSRLEARSSKKVMEEVMSTK